MADQLTIADALLIGATILGPTLAVQVQKFMKRAGERRRHELRMSYTFSIDRSAGPTKPTSAIGRKQRR
jgi:hypothetical protein